LHKSKTIERYDICKVCVTINCLDPKLLTTQNVTIIKVMTCEKTFSISLKTD